MSEADKIIKRIDKVVNISMLMIWIFLCLVCIIYEALLVTEVVAGFSLLLGLTFGKFFSWELAVSCSLNAVVISGGQKLWLYFDNAFPRWQLLNLYPRLELAVKKLCQWWIYQSKEYKMLRLLCCQDWQGKDVAYLLAADIWQYHWVGGLLPSWRRQTLQHLVEVMRIVECSAQGDSSLRNYLISLNIPLPRYPSNNPSGARCPLGIVCETMTGYSSSYCPNRDTCFLNLI